MIKKFFIKRGTVIFACVSIIGVVGTTLTAIEDTKKMAKMLEEKYSEKKFEELPKKDKIIETTKNYIPTILWGTATIGTIIASCMFNVRRQNSLTAACMLIEKSYSSYRNKVKELYNEEADKNILSAIVKDNVPDVEVLDNEVILFYDEITQSYIQRTVDEMNEYENKLNSYIRNNGMIDVATWCDLIGSKMDISMYSIGWNRQDILDDTGRPELVFEHFPTKLDGDLECIIVCPNVIPSAGFLR